MTMKPHTMVCIAALLMSCCSNSRYSIPSNAGANKESLIELLDFYKQDSIISKYEAAKYLIEHMGWHSSTENDGVHPDASFLSFEFLKEHIDHAYEQWQSSPYAKDLSFEEFCEYILPYRASRGFGHNVSGRERYEWVVRHIGLPDSIPDLRKLIRHYNKGVHELREHGGKRHARYRDGLNDLLYEDFTDCADKAVQTCLNLRAIGVPCVVEHNLGYRTFKAHHFHCAVWDTANKEWIKFDAEGIRDYPGEGDWTSAELLNLYRETYAPQLNEQNSNNEYKPRGFESPCQVDVTHHTVRVKVHLMADNEGYVPYLTTFHRSNTGLQPFTYGHIDGSDAIFEHVVPTVWYVVTIYPDGKEKIISPPFWVTETGNGESIITYANFNNSDNEVEDIVLYRKYPIKERLIKRASTLIGSTIVGANKSDFSDARILWTLDSMPQPKVLRYPFINTGLYRFYQLRTPAACEVSVLEWMTADGKIHTPSESNKAYDGDMTTAPTDSAEITLTLPDKQRIVAVNLAPINADNAITPAHMYQLFTWNKQHGWIKHSSQMALTDSIKFTQVPKNTLLWLKDITKGQEEMPMYHKDNRQHFIYI